MPETLDETPAHGEMPGSAMDSGEGVDAGGQGRRVLVELRVGPSARSAFSAAASLPGLSIDTTYDPVPMKSSSALSGVRSATTEDAAAKDETVIVRAFVDPSRIDELKADPNVLEVWSDGRIEPFGAVLDDAQVRRRHL
jgi:hypothetical protein